MNDVIGHLKRDIEGARLSAIGESMTGKAFTDR